MSALMLWKSPSLFFNWISHQPACLSLFGIRNNMNQELLQGQDNQDQDTQQQKLNELLKGAFDFTNRNARPPKKSNHGARPCSSVMRRLKKKYYYRRTKEAMTPEMEPKKAFEV